MKNAIIVAYDISSTSTRTRFSKFLSKYGVRVQFSVFEIKNSNRILNIVTQGIERSFKKDFELGDSIYIFKTDLDDSIRYGSAQLLDKGLIMI